MKCFLMLFGLFCLAQANTLPDYLQPHICRKSVPNFEKCLAKEFKKIIPYIVQGIPEVGLPSLDPLECPEFEVDTVLNELTRFKGKISNLKVTGLGDVILIKLHADPEDLSGEVKAIFPFTHGEFNYEMSGQFLGVPIDSKGWLSGNFTDTMVSMKGKLKTVDENGRKFFQIDNSESQSYVGDGKVKIKTTDPEMEYAANMLEHIYNANARLFMDVVNPIYVKHLNDGLQDIVNVYLGKFPANELLPE